MLGAADTFGKPLQRDGYREHGRRHLEHTAKIASGVVTRKSQASANSKPPPSAMPWTTAIVGRRSASIALVAPSTSATNFLNQLTSFPSLNSADLATEAEVGTLRPHDQHADVADACLVNGLPKRLTVKPMVQTVEWRIGEDEVADIISLRSKRIVLILQLLSRLVGWLKARAGCGITGSRDDAGQNPCGRTACRCNKFFTIVKYCLPRF